MKKSSDNDTTLTAGDGRENAAKVGKTAQRFAELMIDRITRVQGDWQKPWVNTNYVGMPQNLEGRHYNGMNAVMLTFLREEKEWKTPVFMTFKQAKDNGCDIKKGETGFPVQFYRPVAKDAEGKPMDIDTYNSLPDEQQKECKLSYISSVHTVFNVEQTRLPEVDPERWQQMLDKFGPGRLTDNEGKFYSPELEYVMANDAWVCPIRQMQGDQAYYSVSGDRIVVPEKSQFAQGEQFYGTLLHEMAHSTGAESRLGRFGTGSGAKTSEYGREELVAEMTAILMATQMGFSKYLKDDSAMYLKAWLDSIKEEPNYIMTIMSDVNKAAGLIQQHVMNPQVAEAVKQQAVESINRFLDDKKAEQQDRPAAPVLSGEAFHRMVPSIRGIAGAQPVQLPDGILQGAEAGHARYHEAGTVILVNHDEYMYAVGDDARALSGKLGLPLQAAHTPDGGTVDLVRMDMPEFDARLTDIVRSGLNARISSSIVPKEDIRLTYAMHSAAVMEYNSIHHPDEVPVLKMPGNQGYLAFGSDAETLSHITGFRTDTLRTADGQEHTFIHLPGADLKDYEDAFIAAGQGVYSYREEQIRKIQADHLAYGRTAGLHPTGIQEPADWVCVVSDMNGHNSFTLHDADRDTLDRRLQEMFSLSSHDLKADIYSVTPGAPGAPDFDEDPANEISRWLRDNPDHAERMHHLVYKHPAQEQQVVTEAQQQEQPVQAVEAPDRPQQVQQPEAGEEQKIQQPEAEEQPEIQQPAAQEQPEPAQQAAVTGQPEQQAAAIEHEQQQTAAQEPQRQSARTEEPKQLHFGLTAGGISVWEDGDTSYTGHISEDRVVSLSKQFQKQNVDRINDLAWNGNMVINNTDGQPVRLALQPLNMPSRFMMTPYNADPVQLSLEEVDDRRLICNGREIIQTDRSFDEFPVIERPQTYVVSVTGVDNIRPFLIQAARADWNLSIFETGQAGFFEALETAEQTLAGPDREFHKVAFLVEDRGYGEHPMPVLTGIAARKEQLNPDHDKAEYYYRGGRLNYNTPGEDTIQRLSPELRTLSEECVIAIEGNGSFRDAVKSLRASGLSFTEEALDSIGQAILKEFKLPPENRGRDTAYLYAYKGVVDTVHLNVPSYIIEEPLYRYDGGRLYERGIPLHTPEQAITNPLNNQVMAEKNENPVQEQKPVQQTEKQQEVQTGQGEKKALRDGVHVFKMNPGIFGINIVKDGKPGQTAVMSKEDRLAYFADIKGKTGQEAETVRQKYADKYFTPEGVKIQQPAQAKAEQQEKKPEILPKTSDEYRARIENPQIFKMRNGNYGVRASIDGEQQLTRAVSSAKTAAFFEGFKGMDKDAQQARREDLVAAVFNDVLRGEKQEQSRGMGR